MCMCDWSSDVCSSELAAADRRAVGPLVHRGRRVSAGDGNRGAGGAGDRGDTARAGAPPDACADGRATRRSAVGGMKAIRIAHFGGPDVLEVADMTVPRPAADEVIIRVAAAGGNFAETLRRQDRNVG